MSWVICFTLMASTSIFFSVYFNKRFEESMPLITFAIILFLFLFGLIDKLKFGLYFTISMMIIIVIYSIVKVIRERKIRQTIDNIFTPTFFIFLILSFLIWYLNRNMVLSGWDEFSHWGRVVKATFLTNKISTYTNVDLLFRTYPPAISLFQYFILFFRGVWNEADLYRSYSIIGLILFLPFLKNLKWQSKKSIDSSILLIIFSPMLFYNNYYNVIFIDAILAMFFGYCLAEIYLYDSKDTISLIRLCLAISVLTIIKDVGLFYAFISSILLIYKMIYLRKKQNYFELVYKLFACKYNFLFFLIPLITNWLWKLNIKLTNTIQTAFTNSVNLSELFNVLLGRSNNYRQTVLHNFVSSLFKTPLTSNMIAFSFIIWTLILISMLYLLCVIKKDKSEIYSRLNIIIIIGLITYTFGLLITYLFKFSEYEAIILASFSRYIGNYLEAIVICITMISITWFHEVITHDNKQQEIKITILKWVLIIIFLISIPISNITNFISENNAIVAKSVRTPFNEIIKKVDMLSINSNSKIWIICEHTAGFEYWILQFDLINHLVNPNFTWSIGQKSSKDDLWTLEIEVNEWEKRLQEYDYVIIYNVDNSFIQGFGSIFKDTSEIKSNSIYKIEKTGSEIELVFLK